ncbi:MAG: hypothetical protein COX70_03350, partial [Flavobacteriales bacterium CG_4_10_14_0_2_um_filter_32_8]
TLNFPELVVNAVHPDTLQNSSVNTITGQIEDDNGVLQSWFTGNLIVLIQGSKDTISTLANDGGSPFVFYDRRKVIFYDTIPILNGLFNYNINLNTLPIHITGNAKINYYAFNGNVDASGCNDSIYINDLLTSMVDYSTTAINATIFPNPSSNNVTVSLTDFSNDNYSFNLYNNMGQVILENKMITTPTFTFSVQNFTNGIYYYSLTNESNQYQAGKLIVQH